LCRLPKVAREVVRILPTLQGIGVRSERMNDAGKEKNEGVRLLGKIFVLNIPVT
jgi:hypothetical protein